MVSLCWLRNDLRAFDNTALWHAGQRGSVVALYYATPQQWLAQDMAGCRAAFLLRSLRSLQAELAERGIPLLYREVPSFADIADDIAALAAGWDDCKVFWNREYAVNEAIRDRQVAAALEARGLAWAAYDDFYIAPPGSVTRGDGEPYQVFTPFSRAWKGRITGKGLELLPAPGCQVAPRVPESGRIPVRPSGFTNAVDDSLWPAGEGAAERCLQHFVEAGLDTYAEHRDIPSRSGTSRLSPHLAAGTISARRCLVAAMDVNRGELSAGSRGVQTWINELAWREFYGHILAANPRLSKHRAFRTEYDGLPWRSNAEQFLAWCQGRTGVPLVEAGMRQLAATGWMHNRVRMVTAMFLSKNLLLDWRLGERHFMRHLIDGDLAQNNGGWQWCASTGTDAAPYFRIFNPFTQAQRFDPAGDYIRTWVPELGGVPAAVLHDPGKLARWPSLNYAPLIVDLATSRQRAMAVFKQAGRPA